MEGKENKKRVCLDRREQQLIAYLRQAGDSAKSEFVVMAKCAAFAAEAARPGAENPRGCHAKSESV